jgi:hypothetical protein
MSRIFTSTILFNKTAETWGGATFMEERTASSGESKPEAPEQSETPQKKDFDPKAIFDSYMSEFKEETPQPESTEKSNDNSWSPLKSFHAYLDALEKEPDLYRLVVDGIKELRERVNFVENGEKDYNDEGFSLTGYDISLKPTERQMENVYSSHSNFDILYILLNWMQEAGVRGDCSYNDAYPLAVIQNEDICYIWSIMIFKDGTLKECSIGESRNNKETPINFHSIEDIQIAIANKPFQFSNYKSGGDSAKSSSDESEEMVSLDDVLKNAAAARAAKESSSQQPSFPPLTAEAIKFIDSKILEKGGITEIDEKEVEEIWEGLGNDFGLVDKNLSEEEINKWAASIVAYLQHEQSKL